MNTNVDELTVNTRPNAALGRLVYGSACVLSSAREPVYGAYNMTKLFEFELCKFELLTSVI